MLTPYSMVWDWRVSKAGLCFFIGLSCSIPTIIFYSFSLSLLFESVGKADLLSDHFDSKQSREAVALPLTCHPSLSLTTFVFRLVLWGWGLRTNRVHITLSQPFTADLF